MSSTLVKNVDERGKQIEFYKKEIKFFENKLNNPGFVEKAPKKVVDEQKRKLENARNNLKLIS